ncbi:MAG: ATP-dependent DNA helicase [Acidimicrobiales bacterium]
MSFTETTTRSLNDVAQQLPGGGESRPGQVEMAVAVANAIACEEHLVVQAGTGTGKSLAYLIPALLSDKRTIIATATKALQDQLATKDLPFLSEHLDKDFEWAVLKGRSNYVCLQRLDELDDVGDQLQLDGLSEGADNDEIEAIREWAETSATGDRASLDFEPGNRTWVAVSVGPRECPGRNRCPRGNDCFAEMARDEAAAADVLVVNTHLYGIDLASDGAILGEHDLVILDEAHQTEDIMSSTFSWEVGGGRFMNLARNCGAVINDDALLTKLFDAGDSVMAELETRVGERLAEGLPVDLHQVLDDGRTIANSALQALRNVDDEKLTGKAKLDVATRKQRAMQAGTALIEDLDLIMTEPTGMVSWVDGPVRSPTLKVTPVEIGGLLSESLWNSRTAILTSATIPEGMASRLGLDDQRHTQLDVGSPFDFGSAALLYCPVTIPEPRDPDYRDAMLEELEALMLAAGGRTLALFTSYRAMNDAAEYLDGQMPFSMYTQGDLPKPALLEAFADDEESCLLATMSFWQGIDVPGPALSLVIIDKLPFPRPDDPVLQARRELAGPQAFRLIDLPRAATLLAQGAGRLIRTKTDVGMVAVLDQRLATKRAYRWDMINALPPMRRTKDRAEAVAYLNAIRD